MSLSWRRELVVGLAPGGAQLGRRRASLAELARARPRAAWRVVLSNHYLRYDLLPWDAGIATPAERALQARVRLRGVHGAVAEGWAVGVDGRAEGAAALACAADRGLLDAISAALGRAPRACVPYAAVAFNRWRRSLRGAAFRFAVIEPGRLWLGRAAIGRWTGALTRRLGGEAIADALAALQREEEIAGQAPTFAVVSGLGEDAPRPLEAAGVRVLQVEPELPLCLA